MQHELTPYLVTAPTALPVTLDAVKDQLRIGRLDYDQDDHLRDLIDAAVAFLDGPRGVLGRCIMPQTWAAVASCGGTYTLPFPDVTEATADYGAGAVALDVTITGGGPQVTLAEAGTVTFTCAMPEVSLPHVAQAVKLIVQRDFDQPSGPEGAALDRAIDHKIASVRWRRV